MRLREVVVIDGRDADRLHCGAILEAAQVADRVIGFATAEEALEFLQYPEGHEVDLVLLGVGPDGLDGLDFLQAHDRLHEHQRAGAIVAMSDATHDSAMRPRALGTGAVKHWFVKPLDPIQARELPAIARGEPGAS